ncbi:MAG TPA: endonuclease [Ignavibacteriaceae bacterium]|nr:endonuclease [Ignavibacteriaceae bacterium]
MIKRLLLITVIVSANIYAQVYVNPGTIEFSQVTIPTTDSTSFYVINYNEYPVTVNLNNLKAVYTLSDTLMLIPPEDSIIIWIKYHPNQNVIDADVVLITSTDSTIGAAVDVIGSAKYNDIYDAATFNKFDIELKSALNNLVINHTSLGYILARDKMFMEIDNQKVNGQGASQNTLECVYTGRKAIGYTSRTNAQSNYNFNTEHTWPQSSFGENEPMKSDLFHLFPTDNPANAIRANYPFGKVVSNITWDSAGSKLGKNYLNQTVFEPRDVHKGDVSRSMFYFITRYPVNYGGFFTQTQESVFRDWNKFDPVSIVESNRNNAIASYQLKRNPFIDHPEFANRIYSFVTNTIRPTAAELEVLPTSLPFDSTIISYTATKSIYLINTGSAELIIDSIIISDQRFYISDPITDIEPYSVNKLEVNFSPDSIKTFFASLNVFTNAGNKQINLTGSGKENTVNVTNKSQQPATFALSQNYPNPFNPATRIQYSISSRQFVSLNVYDVLGNLVARLVNEDQPAGSYEVDFYALGLSSGIYLYKLQAGTSIQTKKMILAK